MPLCEMCGREARLLTAQVEAVELAVCKNCAKYGAVKKTSQPTRNRSFRRTFVRNNEPVFRIVSNYDSLIRSAREGKEMSQEDFSKFLNEKESLIAKWETGNLRPRLATARKLERILGIRLVRKEEGIPEEVKKKQKSDVLTVGDFVKVRKRW